MTLQKRERHSKLINSVYHEDLWEIIDEVNGQGEDIEEIIDGTLLTPSSLYPALQAAGYTNVSNQITTAAITPALGEYGPLQNMRAGVANVLDYGAVGDGATDDTAAFYTALDSIGPRGGELIIPPREYLVPEGITEDIPGLRVRSGGTRYLSPGTLGLSGAVIKTTEAGAWCWSHGPASSAANEYRGCAFENITFLGDGDTAGGLRVRTNNNQIAGCGFQSHGSGTGLQFEFPAGGADDASWNDVRGCISQNCLLGYDIGGDVSGASSGGTYVGNVSMGQSGSTGMRISSSNVSVLGGKFEAHDTGLEITANNGVSVVGTRFEGCTTGAWLNRSSQPFWSHHHLIGIVIASGTTSVLIGANNAGDVVCLQTDIPIVDNGTSTTIISDQLTQLGTNNLGFYGTAAVSRPTITGSVGGNAALISLLEQLEALGLIVDGSS